MRHTHAVTTNPKVGRIIIDWVDATDDDAPTGEYNFGWRIAPDPPIDDERMAVLLHEIANAT